MHIVLVYLQTFRRNLLLKCVLQQKIEKKKLPTPLFLFGEGGFKVVQGYRCL